MQRPDPNLETALRSLRRAARRRLAQRWRRRIRALPFWLRWAAEIRRTARIWLRASRDATKVLGRRSRLTLQPPLEPPSRMPWNTHRSR